jgi:hypothetical protein
MKSIKFGKNIKPTFLIGGTLSEGKIKEKQKNEGGIKLPARYKKLAQKSLLPAVALKYIIKRPNVHKAKKETKTVYQKLIRLLLFLI